jgi:tetratricopeptide (TPR) repeat protein
MNINPKLLIQKLNPSVRSALEAATGLCSLRTHYEVEIEHYLSKLLDVGGGDFEKIRRRFGIDDTQLSADLAVSLDALKSGSGRGPLFNPTVGKMLTEAWTVGSLEFAQAKIRTGTTILALVSDPELGRMVRRISTELQRIDARLLHAGLIGIVAGSAEDAEAAVGKPPATQAAENATLAAENKRLDEYVTRWEEWKKEHWDDSAQMTKNAMELLRQKDSEIAMLREWVPYQLIEWEVFRESCSGCGCDPCYCHLRTALSEKAIAIAGCTILVHAEHDYQEWLVKHWDGIAQRIKDGLETIRQKDAVIEGLQDRVAALSSHLTDVSEDSEGLEYGINIGIGPMGKLRRNWLLTMGAAYGKWGQYSRAISCFNRVIAVNPMDAEAHLALGVSYRFLKQYTQAAAAFRKAVSLAPQSPDAHLALGSALARAEQYQDAIPKLKEAIRLRPHFGDAHLLLGLCCLALNDRAGAETEMRILSAIDPSLEGQLRDAAGKMK